MELNENRGIKAGRWLANEILRNEDINYVAASAYENICDLAATLAEQGIATGATADTVLSGCQLIWDAALTCYLKAGIVVSFSGEYQTDAGWGFIPTAGAPFAVIVPEDTAIAFDAGGAADRYDLLEIRPVRNTYSTKSRQFKDPITGGITSALTDTRYEYGFEFLITKGVEGAGVAPAGTAGWIKVAEVFVELGVGAISQAKIADVRDSDAWTTDADTTIFRRIHDFGIDWGTGANQVSAADVPIADAGAIITGTEVETALQELAGAGRVAQTLANSVQKTGNETVGGVKEFSDGITIDGETITKITQFFTTPVVIGIAEFDIGGGACIPALSALNSTDIAFVTTSDGTISTYRWDGYTWTKVGNSLDIDADTSPTVAALTSTLVAVTDSFTDDLRSYSWDGTDWSAVGNPLDLTAFGFSSMTALSATDIALIDTTTQRLGRYHFDGTDWTQVGNLYAGWAGTIGVPSICTLDGATATVAVFFISGDKLWTMQHDGTDWAQVGTELQIPAASGVITALSSNHIVYNDTAAGIIWSYYWDGANWARFGASLNLTDSQADMTPMRLAYTPTEEVFVVAAEGALNILRVFQACCKGLLLRE